MKDAEIRQWMTTLPEGTSLIETHISYVVLTGEFAYKIKKPIRYSFLNFATVTKRKYYCDRELKLNRRLAPETYLEVVTLCKKGKEIRLGTAETCGKPLDHAVKMRRLDAEMEMDRLLLRNKIGLEYMPILAQTIAEFHQGAAVVHNPKQASAKRYQEDFNDILGQSDAFMQLDAENAGTRLHTIVRASDNYLAAHAQVIRARLDAGYVRDVHGDLHSRNIFAYPMPIVFDCIEFNDHFRQIDLLNEVAFLCMDLEAMGFDGHSKAFLKGYLAEMDMTLTPAEKLLFIWFKLYRANVRAKVNALRSRQAYSPDVAYTEMLRYLTLMERYVGELEAEDLN
jgi:uncharacterized protein